MNHAEAQALATRINHAIDIAGLIGWGARSVHRHGIEGYVLVEGDFEHVRWRLAGREIIREERSTTGARRGVWMETRERPGLRPEGAGDAWTAGVVVRCVMAHEGIPEREVREAVRVAVETPLPEPEPAQRNPRDAQPSLFGGGL